MKGIVPRENIGNFNSVAQKRLYEAGLGIRQAAIEVADRFIALDDQPGDANRPRHGSVLLDGVGSDQQLKGFCRFEPATRAVDRLEAEVVSSGVLLDPVAVAPPRSETTKIERTDEGVTYSTSIGTMRMNSDGSIFVDTDDRRLVTYAPAGSGRVGGLPEHETLRQSYANYLLGR